MQPSGQAIVQVPAHGHGIVLGTTAVMAGTILGTMVRGTAHGIAGTILGTMVGMILGIMVHGVGHIMAITATTAGIRLIATGAIPITMVAAVVEHTTTVIQEMPEPSTFAEDMAVRA
jgi:hypothetical protein